ncbi:VWA domain-containing protein [Candidatus Poribacteria bacterium]|nr:VWA domain-containing protein [Candidatus Poribacteria bacterium]
MDKSPPTVRLAEVSRLLQLYCAAATGKPLRIRSTEEAPREFVREGHHLPLTDGKTIYLPNFIEKHLSREENFAEYKVYAAHQAGYIEFGTFELDIDVVIDHPVFSAFEEQAATVDPEAIVSHYDLFFMLFKESQLARDIFFAIEDGRVDYRLREMYRGLAADMEKVARASLEGRAVAGSLPLREALVEALTRLSITGKIDESFLEKFMVVPMRMNSHLQREEIDESLPEKLLPLYRRICGLFARVLSHSATVTDSAVATARVYLLLGSLPNVSFGSPFLDSATRGTGHAESERMQHGIPAGRGVPESEPLPYRASQPVAFRGQTRPELVQLENAIELLKEAVVTQEDSGAALTHDLLEMLLKRVVKIKISQMTAKELAETSGLFITDLRGVLQEKIGELSPDARKRLAKLLDRASVAKGKTEDSSRVFFYDEWDYLSGDYRPRWCRLREISLEGESSAIVSQIQKEQAALIAAVRRSFQRIRPEMLRKVKRLRSGEEIELNDAIEAVLDRRAGLTPSERVYQKRDRRMRDVATVFLLDLSASTDEWIVEEPLHESGGPRHGGASRSALFGYFSLDAGSERAAMRGNTPANSPPNGATPGGAVSSGARDFSPPDRAMRVIDIEREALVVMAEALESLGDMYAIYGFSGYGRENVEFFVIKDFSEKFSERARRRIGAIKPQKSTRMGPAIRHAMQKLVATDCRLKALILLSDGYPQDYDYGPDRTSRDYGLHDTTVALREARKKKVHTFCVTVDQAGNDYLRAMCGGENYLVVKRPSALPKILPRVYRGLTI